MISAKEIHELRFEKAAFGYKQEDIDEFLTQLEQEVEIAEQEMADSNEKIQVLADKVREYMRDEDALKVGGTAGRSPDYCRSKRQGRRHYCRCQEACRCHDGRSNRQA